MEYILKRKKGLLLGAATSATQIEGGVLDSSWQQWYQQGHIVDGSNPACAADHYMRVDEDTEWITRLGLEVYRMGIDWARIQPSAEQFDMTALLHYKDEICKIQQQGVPVLLTLHHFTNPMWFERKGGFLQKEAPDIFCRYVAKVLEVLGEDVAEYVTINEPNVYMCNGFLIGCWPPGRKSLRQARRVYANLIRCHTRAYRMIHDYRSAAGYTDTRVGIADHVRAFAPENPKNPWQSMLAKVGEKWAQRDLTDAILTGRGGAFVQKPSDVVPGKYYDFIGLNYYTRNSFHNFGCRFRKDAPQNDLGWEIYPKGLGEMCEQMGRRYHAPIYITENGVCDNTDRLRPQFIYDHLKVLFSCDAPVERYYHWSLMDNFEWADGQEARFGLLHIDYDTQQRTLKKSGQLYRDIIANDGVTQEMAEQYGIIF